MTTVKFLELRTDVEKTVRQALSAEGIVNVPLVAEVLQRRHEHLNIALEDIEALVLDLAQFDHAPVLFDSRDQDRPI